MITPPKVPYDYPGPGFEEISLSNPPSIEASSPSAVDISTRISETVNSIFAGIKDSTQVFYNGRNNTPIQSPDKDASTQKLDNMDPNIVCID